MKRPRFPCRYLQRLRKRRYKRYKTYLPRYVKTRIRRRSPAFRFLHNNYTGSFVVAVDAC